MYRDRNVWSPNIVLAFPRGYRILPLVPCIFAPTPPPQWVAHTHSKRMDFSSHISSHITCSLAVCVPRNTGSHALTVCFSSPSCQFHTPFASMLATFPSFCLSCAALAIIIIYVCVPALTLAACSPACSHSCASGRTSGVPHANWVFHRSQRIRASPQRFSSPPKVSPSNCLGFPTQPHPPGFRAHGQLLSATRGPDCRVASNHSNVRPYLVALFHRVYRPKPGMPTLILFATLPLPPVCTDVS